MILIGMYDSPFVRRVAISLSLLGMTFEHRNWSVGKDAAKIREFHPQGRVPVLVLDDGETLTESSLIVDWLDRLLKNASHCGLGSAAPNPVIDTLQKFRPAYERRLVSLDFEPAFDLDAALAEARQLTARDDPGAHLKTHEEEEK